MKIICLMENTAGDVRCETEHGFSVYIEMEEKIVLIDTGASELFCKNAQSIGVDLSKAEVVFISHGHYDHTGGISAFREKNPKAEIVLQRKAFGDYWHKSETTERYIGMESGIRKLGNLRMQQGDYRYSKEIDVFTGNLSDKTKLEFWPKGNMVLKEKIGNMYVQDDFSHEQYVVLKEKEKLILVSGCAHNGILNILKVFRENYSREPDVIISGFHMKKKTDYTQEDVFIIKETAKRLKETNILCYTGHCTGEEPYEIMKEIMGEQLQYIHCGDVIEC